MRGMVAVGLALVMAGCGRAPDPNARLTPGEKVLVVSGESGRQVALVATHGQVEVDSGTAATVADDRGPESDPLRPVSVHVDDGPHRGAAGAVRRFECRPLP